MFAWKKLGWVKYSQVLPKPIYPVPAIIDNKLTPFKCSDMYLVYIEQVLKIFTIYNWRIEPSDVL